MNKLFVPYTGEEPTAVSVNGHRVIFVSAEQSVFDRVALFEDVDRVEEIETANLDSDIEEALGSLAEQVQGGVVVIPKDVPFNVIMDNLESELPWVH